MPQDNKKLIFQVEGLYNKFLLELAELEKRRQEILSNRSRITPIAAPNNAESSNNLNL